MRRSPKIDSPLQARRAFARAARRRLPSLMILCIAALVSSCGRFDLGSIIKPRIASLRDPSFLSIDELQRSIDEHVPKAEQAKLGKAAGAAVDTAARLAAFRLVLSRRYMEKEMYKDAYDVLAAVADTYPEDASVFYNAALAAAHVAKSRAILGPAGDAEKRRWFLIAESSYRRALEIKPRHGPALYGLAVLYSYELGEPAKAELLLRALLAFDTKNPDAMLLMGRVSYQLGRLDDSARWYGAAVEATAVPEKKKLAEENRLRVVAELEGKK